MANLRREHVEAFIAYLLERWKPSTANNRFRGLQAFFKWLEEEGELTQGNPMGKMKPPRVPEDPPDVLKEPELKRLLAACAGPDFEARRDVALVRVFADTGGRLSEITNVRWNPRDGESNDVDLDQGQVRVMGKGRRVRLLPLGAKSVQAIDHYIRLRARHPHASQDWLWLGQKGRMTDSGIRQVFWRRGVQAGLEDEEEDG